MLLIENLINLEVSPNIGRIIKNTFNISHSPNMRVACHKLTSVSQILSLTHEICDDPFLVWLYKKTYHVTYQKTNTKELSLCIY